MEIKQRNNYTGKGLYYNITKEFNTEEEIIREIKNVAARLKSNSYFNNGTGVVNINSEVSYGVLDISNELLYYYRDDKENPYVGDYFLVAHTAGNSPTNKKSKGDLVGDTLYEKDNNNAGEPPQHYNFDNMPQESEIKTIFVNDEIGTVRYVI